MSARWVAGAVRSKAIAQRRLGAAGARALAASPSLPAALQTLVAAPYRREVHVDQTLAQAQHAVRATLLWHLRVLAGWQPRSGVEVLRVLTGWFEVANVDEHLAGLSGVPTEPPYHLGTLATAWPRLREATSAREVRAELATSAWGDPGGETPYAIGLGMRVAWAERVSQLDGASAWAAGGAALLLARELFVHRQPVPETVAPTVDGLLGPDAREAVSLPDLARRVRPDGAWALAGVERETDLWRAQSAWWHRVEDDALAALRRPDLDGRLLLAAATVLAVDAWRTCAALELAARGGGPLEVFDDVA